VLVRNPERRHLEDLGIGGRIILESIFKEWVGSVDCIDLAQERERWRAVVNAIIELLVPENQRNFLTN
jgi:hypothetical protein